MFFFQSIFVDTFTKHKKHVDVLKSKSFIFPFLSAYLTNTWTYFLKAHNPKVCITSHVRWTYFLKAHNAKVCITSHVTSRKMSKLYKLYNLQKHDWLEMATLRRTSSFSLPIGSSCHCFNENAMFFTHSTTNGCLFCFMLSWYSTKPLLPDRVHHLDVTQ
jgi:hypothetical protein